MKEGYILMTRFKSPVMTAGEYLQFSKRILSELAAFDNCFKNMHGWGTTAKAWSGFKPDLSDFDPIVLKQIEDKEIRYENPDPNNWDITPDSKCFVHYSNSYSNTKKIKEGQITVTISAGSNGLNRIGILNIEFPEFNYSQFQEYGFVNRLLKKCIELTDAKYAVVMPNNYLIKQESKENNSWVGWQTYLADQQVAGYLPQEINRELFNRGVIFSLDKNIVYSDNDTAINKAIEIRNILETKGLLNLNDIKSDDKR
jgi:hypothetical protein